MDKLIKTNKWFEIVTVPQSMYKSHDIPVEWFRPVLEIKYSGKYNFNSLGHALNYIEENTDYTLFQMVPVQYDSVDRNLLLIFVKK